MTRLLVAVKRVIDYNAKVRVKGGAVDLSNVKMSINPFCAIAAEEALRLKEKALADEVVAVTIGPKQAADALRTVLAMGADRGYHVQTEAEVQPLAVAKLLAAVAARETPAMVLLGKQAIDDDSNQTGQMLGALLGWPQATFASSVEVDAAAGRATVVREVDGGLETVRVGLPAVVTADLRLNEPRYATLPNIMKAKKKPVVTLTPEELGVDVAPRLETLGVEEPAARKAGVVLSSPAELVARLRDEAKVL